MGIREGEAGLPDDRPPHIETVDLREKIDADLAKGDSVVDVTNTFINRSGVKMSFAVLSAMLLVLGALFIYLVWMTPASLNFAADASLTARDSLAVDVFEGQRTQVFDNFLRAVEKIVIGVFLPLLTAILGYIFGTRETAARQNADDE